jgi:DNA polymerase-3 subunit alpha (Gram-positive type)
MTSSKEILSALKFCVIDLETTGGSPEKDKIFEIGMTKIENLTITEERSFMVNPEKEIPEFVQRLTGVKQSDVLGAPRFEEIADEVMQFAGDSILVAHNTSFDIPFLNAKLKESGRPTFENRVLCTNVMTKYMIPDIVNSNLEYMGKIFDLGDQKAHRAIEDARVTAKLLLKFMDIFITKDLKKINQLYYPRNRFELDRRHFDRREKELSDVVKQLKNEKRPILLTVKGEQGVILSLLPIENPAASFEKIEAFLSKLQWQMITLRLIGPHIEGLMQLNINFLKIPEATRQETLNFLTQLQATAIGTLVNPLEQDDFLVAPHLIQGQLIVYSLMGFASYSELIFKFPSHKKKLTHFLQGQVNRFEAAKTQRRHQIIQEIKPLIEGHLMLEQNKKDTNYIFLKRQDLKKDQKLFFQAIENLVKNHPDPFHFPSRYI